MSSIAFPAFERAQQEHMSSDRTAEQLYRSVEDAIRAPPSEPACVSNEYNGPNAVQATASSSQSAQGNEPSEQPAPPKPKITKRVNARLQLAAALIEADNERILEKAQFWHIYHPPQAHDLIHPPPPPQPALASQSAIFAPFREGASTAVKRHVRTWSAATGLSRLLDPEDDGKRPSVDFLGVALPNEQRARSRAGSSAAGLAGTHQPHSRTNSLLSNAATSVLGRTSRLGSRPASLLGQGDHEDEADPDADALSQWGVDKFLSKDERERIAAGQRSRAQSLAGSAHTRPSFEQFGPSSTGRKSLDVDRGVPGAGIAAGRASSEIVASSSANAAPGDSKLELLAKIKLYRERQENLPPSEWDGPGPTATKDEVVEHIIASSDDNNKRASLRQASRELSQTSPLHSSNEEEQGGDAAASAAVSSIMNRPRPSSRADSTTSSAFLTAPLTNGPGTDVTLEKADSNGQHASSMHPHSPATSDPLPPSTGEGLVQASSTSSAQAQAIPIAEKETAVPSAEASDMVGVGSFSRSQSRRNSFLGGPMFNPHGEPATTSNAIESQLPMVQSTLHDTAPMAPMPISFGGSNLQHRSWATDQFAEHDLGLGPSPFAAALQAASPSFNDTSELRNIGSGPNAATSSAIDFNTLSTRQLQNMARNSTFPSHLGINRDLLAEEVFDNEEDDPLRQNEFGQSTKRRRQPSFDLTALAQDLARTGGDNFEIQLGDGAAPDLSSANWGKPRKKWFRLSMMMDAKGRPQKPKKTTATDGAEGDGESDAEVLDGAIAKADQLKPEDDDARDLSEQYAAEPSANMAADSKIALQSGEMDDIDDDYVSPPRRGPLRPLGLAARMPKTILMPQPLQGTEFAPKLRLTDAMPQPSIAPQASNRHSLHVPEGFVLHNSRGGLPPMRSLVVHSASGPQPMFAAKDKNKKHEQGAARLKAVQVGRTVQVPAAAPRGIGRRAAAPTTALFRNHLVQHEDEREGWGFEAGTRVDDLFNPDDNESDDDDKPLADIKKQSRSAKRAAKRLAKEKRKRKAARRIRRAKREEALKEGKTFKEVGVDELSPNEDLDLSSTTSEEEVTGSETESDLWASDDDKRWVDDSKPAGKLYGKSLLDLASERTTERKSKARFYGQVQLEDGETTALQIDGEGDGAASQRFGGSTYDDGASIAPSVARSFRDKPVGFNDTRERMEAVFGSDQIWAREMAKRREDEAREAEEAKQKAEIEGAAQQQREAEAKAKKERGLFTLGRKGKKNRETVLGMSNPSAINSAVSFTGSNTGASIQASIAPPAGLEEEEQHDVPPGSQAPAAPPVIALDIDEAPQEGPTGRKSLNLLAGEEEAAQDWLIDSDVEAEKEEQLQDSSDDNVPLAQVKKNVASRPSSLAAGLSLNPTQSGNADSSDEELPLAALKEKRIRQSMLLGGGKLDLDFSSAHNGTSEAQSRPGSSPRSGSLRESTSFMHDGAKSPLSQQAAVRSAQMMDDDDSDEDLPLGQRHPGGKTALANMRVALENQKRAIKEAKQAERAQRRAARLALQVSADDINVVEGAPDDADDDDSEEDDDSEDDKPLGYVHPQAAIIAEQAALIRQLQSEKEEQQQQQQQQQQSRISSLGPSSSGMMSPSGGVDPRSSMMLNRMSGFPSMMGGMGGMGGMGMPDPRQSMVGLPTNGSMMMGMPAFDGLPTSSPGLPFSMSMSTPMQAGMPMAQGSQMGLSGGMQPGGMTPAMTMPMMANPAPMPMTPNPMAMMLDPKASSIHNWRTQVPADATATITPPGGASAVNSAV